MSTLLITLSVFFIAFLGMAIGVLIANKSIKGSCGGIGKLMGKSACEICDKKSQCEEKKAKLCNESA